MFFVVNWPLRDVFLYVLASGSRFLSLPLTTCLLKTGKARTGGIEWPDLLIKGKRQSDLPCTRPMPFGANLNFQVRGSLIVLVRLSLIKPT